MIASGDSSLATGSPAMRSAIAHGSSRHCPVTPIPSMMRCPGLDRTACMSEILPRARRRGTGRSPRTPAAALDPLPRLEVPWSPLEILTRSRSSASSTPLTGCWRKPGSRSAAQAARAFTRAPGAHGRRGDASWCASAATSSRPQLAHAPERFVLHARNAERHLHVGGNVVNFGPVNGAPNASDLERGRRYGDIAAFREILQAHPHARHAALAGRHRRRTGRRAGSDPSSRDVPRPHRVRRHRLGRARRRRRAGRGRDRDVGHRARLLDRRPRRTADADDRDQRQLAAARRRGDPRQHHDHGAPRPVRRASRRSR